MNSATKNQHPNNQVFNVSIDVPPQGGSKCFDDDGRLKRTGLCLSFSFFFPCLSVFKKRFFPTETKKGNDFWSLKLARLLTTYQERRGRTTTENRESPVFLSIPVVSLLSQNQGKPPQILRNSFQENRGIQRGKKKKKSLAILGIDTCRDLRTEDENYNFLCLA